MRFFVLPLLCLLGALPMAGCKGCRANNSAAGDAAPNPSASSMGLTTEQAQKVVAKIGDSVITLGDFAQALADLPEFERLRFQSLERRKELLKNMVDVHVLAAEARRSGLDKDPLVAQEIRQILVAYMRRKLLEQLPAPSDLKDEEVRTYFDAHRDQYREPERRRISVIVTKTEAEAKKAAEEAKATTATGWGELVKKYSDDKPAATEAPEMMGDIGFVLAPSEKMAAGPKVTNELRVAAFSLKSLGDVAGPFKDAVGYRVIRLIAKNEARDQAFADVERSLRIRILQERRAQAEQALIDEMKKSLKVEIDETALAALANELASPAPAASSALASASGSGSASVAPSTTPSASTPPSASTRPSASR